jgi:hypothetical protein
MEALPPNIESYGVLGLVAWLVGKEALKPLLDSFIEKNKKQLDSELSIRKSDQEVLQSILIDAVKRIPDCLDNLRDCINRQIEKDNHRTDLLEQMLERNGRIDETFKVVSQIEASLRNIDGRIDAALITSGHVQKQ